MHTYILTKPFISICIYLDLYIKLNLTLTSLKLQQSAIRLNEKNLLTNVLTNIYSIILILSNSYWKF